MLYDGPFVVERLEAAGRILAENPEAIIGPVRTILEGALHFDAQAAFEAHPRLARLRRRAHAVLAAIDFLFVPTAPTIYSIADVEAVAAAPQRRARRLCELRQPAGPRGARRPDRLPRRRLAGRRDADRRPGGGTRRWRRSARRCTGRRPRCWARPAAACPDAEAPPSHRRAAGSAADRGRRRAPVGRAAEPRADRAWAPASCAPPARRRAIACTRCRTRRRRSRAWCACRPTASRSRSRSGRCRPRRSGAFVARVPAPLCIGTLELDDGARVSGFLCEAPRAGRRLRHLPLRRLARLPQEHHLIDQPRRRHRPFIKLRRSGRY